MRINYTVCTINAELSALTRARERDRQIDRRIERERGRELERRERWLSINHQGDWTISWKLLKSRYREYYIKISPARSLYGV